MMCFLLSNVCFCYQNLLMSKLAWKHNRIPYSTKCSSIILLEFGSAAVVGSDSAAVVGSDIAAVVGSDVAAAVGSDVAAVVGSICFGYSWLLYTVVNSQVDFYSIFMSLSIIKVSQYISATLCNHSVGTFCKSRLCSVCCFVFPWWLLLFRY